MSPIGVLDFEILDDTVVESAELGSELEPAGPLRIIPRDYQMVCAERCWEAWAEGLLRLLVVMATGLGKTVFFSMIIERVVREGGRVLIIAHTDELLNQAAEKLQMVCGIRSAREKAEDRASRFDKVVVSSIQTLGRLPRLQTWANDNFALVVIDECHRACSKSYETIITHFSGAKILGVTATPDRGDEKSLGRIFQRLVFDYGLLSGVRDGWLVRPVALTVPLKVDLRGVKLKKGPGGADLDASEVARRLDPFLEEIADNLITHAGKRKTLVFLPSVDTSITLAEKLKARGATADFVSGDRERCPDRVGRVERFRADGAQFMCNAYLLVEGFDDPTISCICVLRPTKIRSLFVQCCGRGTRPLAGVVDGIPLAELRRAAIAASAKPDMLILDFLWLSERLDLARPAHIVAGKPEVAELMKGKQGDLVGIEEQAERDLLETLAKAAKKHSKKKGRLFDPLERAVKLGGQEVAEYKPENAWESMPPTGKQIKELQKAGVDTSQITTCGLASKWLQVVERREAAGLCTLKQMLFFEQLGEKNAAYLTRDEANRRMRLKYT